VVGRAFSMQVEAIVDLDDVVEHLQPGGGAAHEIGTDDLARIAAYRAEYGVPGRLTAGPG